jgi:ABC-type multidrug transport system fused ATPase/permease subunit
MEEVKSLIHDSFEVISLILVFAFVLFDIRYPQIVKQLQKDIPHKDRIKDRERYTKDLRQVLLIGALPLVLIYGALLYLFTPTLISTIANTEFRLLRFDFLLTAFILVYIFILVFFFWSIYLAVRLINRARETSTQN